MSLIHPLYGSQGAEADPYLGVGWGYTLDIHQLNTPRQLFTPTFIYYGRLTFTKPDQSLLKGPAWCKGG